MWSIKEPLLKSYTTKIEQRVQRRPTIKRLIRYVPPLSSTLMLWQSRCQAPLLPSPLVQIDGDTPDSAPVHKIVSRNMKVS